MPLDIDWIVAEYLCSLRVRRSQLLIMVVACASVLLLGCPPKEVKAPAPPPPPPPAPVATIEVAPTTLQAGQSATLSWKTENADHVSLEPFGPVDTSGSRSVEPTESVTYRIHAQGPGGVKEEVARLTVVPVAAEAPKQDQQEDLFGEPAGKRDIFFENDQYIITPDQLEIIKKNADFLKAHTSLRIVIEGYCDELGSSEYNMVLGANRANEVKTALVGAGVDANRISTISYGKEKPFCTEQTEECWKQNRRAHFVADIQQ